MIQRLTLERRNRFDVSLGGLGDTGDDDPLSGNGVGSEGPAFATQMIDDRRVTTVCADAGVEGFGDRLPDIPVWNE